MCRVRSRSDQVPNHQQHPGARHLRRPQLQAEAGFRVHHHRRCKEGRPQRLPAGQRQSLLSSRAVTDAGRNGMLRRTAKMYPAAGRQSLTCMRYV